MTGPLPDDWMLLDERTVSRKTPLDGRLEISAPAADQLAAVGDEFGVVCEGRDGRGRLHSMPCTCDKAGAGGHVHHFVESPVLATLTPGAVVRVRLNRRGPAIRVEPVEHTTSA